MQKVEPSPWIPEMRGCAAVATLATHGATSQTSDLLFPPVPWRRPP